MSDYVEMVSPSGRRLKKLINASYEDCKPAPGQNPEEWLAEKEYIRSTVEKFLRQQKRPPKDLEPTSVPENFMEMARPMSQRERIAGQVMADLIQKKSSNEGGAVLLNPKEVEKAIAIAMDIENKVQAVSRAREDAEKARSLLLEKEEALRVAEEILVRETGQEEIPDPEVLPE